MKPVNLRNVVNKVKINFINQNLLLFSFCDIESSYKTSKAF